MLSHIHWVSMYHVCTCLVTYIHVCYGTHSMNCWLLSLSASVVYSVPAWAVYIFLFSQILSSFSFNCFGVGCQACIPSSGNQASWISLSSGMAHYKYATCWFLRYLRVDAVDADNLSHMGGRVFLHLSGTLELHSMKLRCGRSVPQLLLL